MQSNLRSSSIIVFIFIILFSGCGDSGKKESQEPAKKGRTVVPETSLTFLSESGENISTIEVALADEPMERNQGLMDVRSMPENVGMLFIFDENAPKSFYMANTLIPLDIMYVNSDSVIVRIYQNTTPFSSESLPSGAPARFVVETNGGYSIAHGITEGMKVRF